MFKEILGKIAKVVIEHQPVVAGVALVGSVIITGIVIYKESPKIHKAFDDRKEDIEDIKATEDLTEEQKKEEIDRINMECAKKVVPSVGKMVAAGALTVGALCALHAGSAAVTATMFGGHEIANAKIEAFEKAVNEKTPEKAADIKAEVDKAVKEAMKKVNGVQNVDESDDVEGVIPKGDKVRIYDEFGNNWVGYYPDVEAAVNKVNRFINDGDDVLLNTFYDWIPGCNTTMLGKVTYFSYMRDQIDVKPTALLNKRTGRLDGILIEYNKSPIINDKKYKATSAERDDHNERYY